MAAVATPILFGLVFDSEDGGEVSQQHWLPLTRLHGVIEVEVKLRLTASQSSFRAAFGAHDQIFVSGSQTEVCITLVVRRERRWRAFRHAVTM
jgi:hypothetical protein